MLREQKIIPLRMMIIAVLVTALVAVALILNRYNGEWYRLIYWALVPIGGIIIGSQCELKALWVPALLVLLLDILAWFLFRRYLPGEAPGVLMNIIALVVREILVILISLGIRGAKHLRQRRRSMRE